MTKRYWMMDSQYEFIEVSPKEFLYEAKDGGANLVNNRIVATIYPDSILWDIEVGNVHGCDVTAINKIVADLETEVGHG